ncbi:hypothetical protein GEV33_014995 [Tenebrio molitor]|uniref:Uncharacterized protein n=2 Tax=Tenebrio molitor TaxID=7067 RepID=A0A8J6H4W6_TENMO|nr:hypothetical protein GEV33_014995 [Tenebrio molitor]
MISSSLEQMRAPWVTQSSRRFLLPPPAQYSSMTPLDTGSCNCGSEIQSFKLTTDCRGTAPQEIRFVVAARSTGQLFDLMEIHASLDPNLSINNAQIQLVPQKLGSGGGRAAPSPLLRPAASPSSVDQAFASSPDKNEEITIQSKLLRKEQVLDFTNADLNVFTRGSKRGNSLRCTEIFRVKTMTFFQSGTAAAKPKKRRRNYKVMSYTLRYYSAFGS